MKLIGENHNINANSLQDELVSARSALESDLDLLLSDDTFSDAFAKYTTAITTGTRSTGTAADGNNYFISGIDDIAITQTSSDSTSAFFGLSNMGFESGTSDLSTFTTNSYNDTLATSLAIAEILIKNDITNSLLLDAGMLQNVGPESTTNSLVRYESQQFFHDTHAMGTIGSTYCMTKYFLGLGVGIEKFMSEMSSIDYLIHLSSEFSRNGRVDMSGSDHGQNSSVHTIVSNKISSNQILGSVEYDQTDTYEGHWGWGGSSPTSLKKIHNTIARSFGATTYFTDETDYFEISGLNDSSSS